MKKTCLKTVMLVVAWCCAMGAWAYDFEANGIYYRITSTINKRVEVVSGDAQYSDNVTIPATVTKYGLTYQVSSIKGHAFYNCSGLTSITIPEGVTSIGEYAFYSCSSLTSIVIPDGVTSIGEYAFYGCSSLTSIVIPDGVTSIEKGLFYNCSGLTSITIPEGITSIGGAAFWGCSNLTSIVIHEGITSIGNYAFYSCSSLQSIEVAEGNANYRSIDGVLFDKNATTLLIFPGGKEGAYTIPDGVTTIGNYAFYPCNGPTSITIHEGITFIEKSAFTDCSIQSFNVVEGNANYSSIDGVLFDKNATTLLVFPRRRKSAYTIPDGVTTIEDYAFYFCSELTSITLSAGITSIGGGAFWGCSSLPSITLPAGIKTIGGAAFWGCSNLQEIHSQAIIPPACEYAFTFMTEKPRTLYVPQGSLKAYKAADEWKDFENIVEEEYSGIEETGTDTMEQAVITACGDGIVVENLPAGTAVTVYTLSGTVVHEGVASGSRTELTLPAGHLYLVKCGSTVTKIAL